MAIDVLCVGHAAFDLCVYVDSFPGENSKCETDQLLESGGGPAANAACLLSRWRNHCAFAGLVGDDDEGRRVLEELEAAGTDLSLVEKRHGHATPFSIILVNKQTGSRTVINRKIHGATLNIDKTALARVSPRVLLFDGHELPASMMVANAFPEAISILDAGSMREGTMKLASQVDYLAASERFAVQSCGRIDLQKEAGRRECVARLREQFSTTVIVTLGERGLVADDGTGFICIPAYPAKTVDTTAAGDIFHGAFTHAILHNMPFEEALRFASMTASLSVRVAGGRQSIPPLETVKEALAHAR